MTVGTDEIKEHHKSLSEYLTGAVDMIAEVEPDDYESRKEGFKGFLEFLRDDLTPHAEGEERSMYPPLRDLVCRYDNPLATMSLDHQAIVSRITAFESALRELDQASEAERRPVLLKAKKIAIELGALVSVHLAKEEIALLPLMEAHMSDQERDAILKGMHE